MLNPDGSLSVIEYFDTKGTITKDNKGRISKVVKQTRRNNLINTDYPRGIYDFTQTYEVFYE